MQPKKKEHIQKCHFQKFGESANDQVKHQDACRHEQCCQENDGNGSLTNADQCQVVLRGQYPVYVYIILWWVPYFIIIMNIIPQYGRLHQYPKD